MARTKTITIEGESFLIAPLNIDQVEEYLLAELPPEADQKYWRNRSLMLIALSLNNASGASNGDSETVETLRKRLDLVSLNALHTAVLDLSGLRTKSPEEQPGELQAVPTDRTSSTSETA